MQLLLLSNSTMAGEPYLEFPMPYIADFLGSKPVNCLFIPYAGVTVSFDDYAAKVNARFKEIGHSITSIHTFNDPVKAVEEADAIVVGGGNTWQLLRMVRQNGLIDAIRKKVQAGTKYIGWSAGSNLACPTIKTTNDMPITDPLGFDALNFLPFQINPHYLDANPDGHGGETREDRILEFVQVNQNTLVAGLREGCMFIVDGAKLNYKGKRPLRIFKYGQAPYEVQPNDDFSFLMK